MTSERASRPARAPLSRRTVLLATALSLTATAPSPPAAHAAADPYDTLRHRWLDLTLGTGYDPAAEPYASRLKETGDLARGFLATLPDAPPPTALWPDTPFDPPAGITPRLRPPVDHDPGVRPARHRLHRGPRPPRGRPARPRPPRGDRLPPRHHPLRQLVGMADRQPPPPDGHHGRAPRPPRRRPDRRRLRRRRPLHPRRHAPRLLRHLHRCQPRRPVPLRRPAGHRRPRPGPHRPGPRRPLTRLPVRHPGRRPLRRRLVRPAHLGRLLRYLRPGHARRARPPLRPARRIRVGGDRPEPEHRPRQRRTRLRPADPRRPGDGHGQRAGHQPGPPHRRRTARPARRPLPRTEHHRGRRAPRPRREPRRTRPLARRRQGLDPAGTRSAPS
ncbi:hypothetical protein SGLAM104S_01901 [Streptomyces glaucescens]